MQYYIFKGACATKETGPVYPQIQKWKPGYNDDKPDSYYSYYNAAKGGIFPDFEPNLDSLLLHGKAKPTDFLSSGLSIGFIINKKLKTLFEQFTLPPHRFFSAKIIYKKEELNDYYLMHIVSDYTDFIDYSKSTFITCGFFNSNPVPLILTSKQDFTRQSVELQNNFNTNTKDYRSIEATEIHLNQKFNKSLDFFKIGQVDINFYISQNLKDALLENNITGCDLQPAPQIFI
jgi:hypothetical protein